MSINEIIIYIMVLFMLIGAVDKCIGGKLGLSEKFEEGIMAMGALALSMAGIMVIAPLLADVLKPIVVPLYGLVGADPSIFATTFIANDMGGAPLALSLAQDPAVGNFAAFVLGSMMGPTIVFTIPVALGIIEKDDRPLLARGILYGLVSLLYNRAFVLFRLGCFSHSGEADSLSEFLHLSGTDIGSHDDNCIAKIYFSA